jgi:Fe-S-cluster containining protein
MEKIAEHLNQPIAEVKEMFWASPGAVVMDQRTQIQFRVGTITPKFDRRKKACVFLTEEGKCRIHEVAPFGCSFFDAHMSSFEAQKRARWGLQVILSDGDYKMLRQTLPFADHYKPRGY